ncbi:MAG: hypothetical protein JNM62_02280 [Flavobacteriales bacterium]|nr:hypothetical protein [Flavobacteriales bacterium]
MLERSYSLNCSIAIALLFASVPSLAQTGEWSWAVQSDADSLGAAWLRAVAMDAEGNTIVGGAFVGAVGIGGLSVGSSGMTDWDAVILKFNPAGELLWAKTGGGVEVPGFASEFSVGDEVHGVSVDQVGNIYAFGDFSCNARVVFDGIEVADSGSYGSFLCKYGPDGTLIYAKEVASNDSVHNFYVDPSGYVDLIGGSPMFWKRLDPDGNEILGWSLSCPTSAYYFINDAPAITRGSDGAVYILPKAEEAFDADPGPDEHIIQAGRGNLLKYDSEGHFLWALESTGWVGMTDVVIDDSGAMYVAGGASYLSGYPTPMFDGHQLDSGGCILKLDESGDLVWMRNISESDGGNLQIANLTLNAQGRLFMSGRVNVQNITGLGHQINGVYVPWEYSDYLVEMDQNGSIEWVDFVTGTSVNWPNVEDVAVDPEGRVAVCGWFSQNVSLGEFDLECENGGQLFTGVFNSANTANSVESNGEARLGLQLVNGKLTFNGLSPRNIRIMDANGRIVYQLAVSTALDVDALSDGIYLITAELEGKAVASRFVVCR